MSARRYPDAYGRQISFRYSEHGKDHPGQFHEWATINGEVRAIVELDDNTIVTAYYKWVRFVD